MKIPVLSRLLKPRASPKNRLYGSTYSFFFGGTASGKTVNERTAMQTTAVYACVRILAETIASLAIECLSIHGQWQGESHRPPAILSAP